MVIGSAMEERCKIKNFSDLKTIFSNLLSSSSRGRKYPNSICLPELVKNAFQSETEQKTVPEDVCLYSSPNISKHCSESDGDTKDNSNFNEAESLSETKNDKSEERIEISSVIKESPLSPNLVDYSMNSENEQHIVVENISVDSFSDTEEQNFVSVEDKNINPKLIKSDAFTISSPEEEVPIILNEIISAETDTTIKLKLLSYLTDKAKVTPELIYQITTNSFLHFTESLLSDFCNQHSKCIKRKEEYKHCFNDFPLIVPILKLLILSENMEIEKIRSAYLYKSDIMTQLMHVVLNCVQNAANIGQRLHKLMFGKTVGCAVSKLNSDNAISMFGDCFGLCINNQKFNIVGYKISSFEMGNCSSTEQLMKFTSAVPLLDKISDDSVSTEEMEWVGLVVTRLLPLKYMLAYTDISWENRLKTLSALIQQQFTDDSQFRDEQQKTFEEGDIVGFKRCDATFNGHPLLMVQYLRGQILAINDGCMMLWAMDVGVMCFTSESSLRHLVINEELSQPALIKFCVLQDFVGDFDETLFINACNLLLLLLQNSSQTGKHMLLSEEGKNIFCLLEHPRFDIRIKILDILLCLSENCKEVCKFLEKHSFDICLAGRLERFAHVYRSNLCKSKKLTNVETLVMTKILSLMLDEKTGTKNWSASKQAVRALKMLHGAEDITWKKFLEKCLFQLGYWSREHGYSATHFGQRNNWKNKNAFHFPSLPKNNTLEVCSSKIILDDVASVGQRSQTEIQTNVAVSDRVVPLASVRDYYIIGSKVDLVPDETHEFMEYINLENLKEVQLAEILCGLLNNNVESSMYFGLSKESVVTGIVLRREDKDVFRNGIDRIMSKCLLPEVRANCYDVIFTPVIKAGDKPSDLSKIHLYVIEVCVRPLMHMAYVVYQGRRCYVRQNKENVEWTVMQKKNYMMEKEEKDLEEIIKNLSECAEESMNSLALFVNKYIKISN